MTIERRHQLRGIARAIECCRSRRGNTVILGCLPVGTAPLLCTEDIERTGNSLNSCIVADVDSHLTLLATLGSNDNDTIGGTATIDRSRRSILQDLNRLNVGRIQGVEILCRGYAINDIERVAAIDGCHTTHTDGRTAATRRCIGHNVDTRQFALHGVHDVGVTLAHGAFHVHHCYRSSQVSLTLDLITGDDDLCQLGCVILHGHLHAVSGRQLLLIIANIAKHQSCAGSDFQPEVAVKVGHSTIAGTLFHHSSTDDTFAGFINHRSGNFLRVHYCTCNKSQ